MGRFGKMLTTFGQRLPFVGAGTVLVISLIVLMTGGLTATDSKSCNEPVYLVVWVEDFDRDKAAPYGDALRDTGIVADHGGKYVAAGKPLVLLEGEWPDQRSFVLELYPCRAAAESMWQSDLYQSDIKPLRDGTGNYTVALFKAL